MKTHVLKLVPFLHVHLKKTFGWVHQKNVRKGFNFYKKITWDDHVNWFRSASKDQTVKNFAILLTADNEHIGNGGLKNIDPLKRTCEQIIYIGEGHHRGKGYGTIASNLIVKYAFAELGMKTIYLYLSRGNQAAKRLYEKTGFVEKKLPPGNIWESSDVPDVIYMEKENPNCS